MLKEEDPSDEAAAVRRHIDQIAVGSVSVLRGASWMQELVDVLI